jgi:hypothetical protein
MYAYVDGESYIFVAYFLAPAAVKHVILIITHVYISLLISPKISLIPLFTFLSEIGFVNIEDERVEEANHLEECINRNSYVRGRCQHDLCGAVTPRTFIDGVNVTQRTTVSDPVTVAVPEDVVRQLPVELGIWAQVNTMITDVLSE